MTRSFYKEIDGHHIVWTCNEDSEDEVARFVAFCVLNPVENEGVVVEAHALPLFFCFFWRRQFSGMRVGAAAS